MVEEGRWDQSRADAWRHDALIFLLVLAYQQPQFFLHVYGRLGKSSALLSTA